MAPISRTTAGETGATDVTDEVVRFVATAGSYANVETTTATMPCPKVNELET